MQAHRGVTGLSIRTTLLKIGRVVFEKNENFPNVTKKNNKKPDPIHFHNTCFYQTGSSNIIVCVNIFSIGCI